MIYATGDGIIPSDRLGAEVDTPVQLLGLLTAAGTPLDTYDGQIRPAYRR